MDVRARAGAIVFRSPSLGVNSLANAHVESQLRDDLPSYAEIRAAAKTVHRRNRKGIQYIVLVRINTVSPRAGIEALQPKTQRKGYRMTAEGCGEIISYILRQTDAVRLNIIGIGCRAKTPSALPPSST